MEQWPVYRIIHASVIQRPLVWLPIQFFLIVRVVHDSSAPVAHLVAAIDTRARALRGIGGETYLGGVFESGGCRCMSSIAGGWS